MVYESEVKTLKQFVKWANRKGAKYPLPGCPVNYDDITKAMKSVCVAMGTVMDENTLSVLVQYAENGARGLALKPENINAIKIARRTLRRMAACHDTESQPTTLPA